MDITTVMRALNDLGPSHTRDITLYISKTRGCKVNDVSSVLNYAYRQGYLNKTEMKYLPNGKVIFPVWTLTERGKAKVSGASEVIKLPQAIVLKAVYDLGTTTLADVCTKLTEQGTTVSHQNLEGAMNRLHDGGYVGRIPRKRRGMPNHWYITEKGETALAEYDILDKMPRKRRSEPISAMDILGVLADEPHTLRQIVDQLVANGYPATGYAVDKSLRRLCDKGLVLKGWAPTVMRRNIFTITEAGKQTLSQTS